MSYQLDISVNSYFLMKINFFKQKCCEQQRDASLLFERFEIFMTVKAGLSRRFKNKIERDRDRTIQFQLENSISVDLSKF